MERAVVAQQAGRLVGFWVRADLGGVVFVLDAASHQELMLELQSLPLYPFLRSIDVMPVISHPKLPEFDVRATPRTDPLISDEAG